MIVNEKNTGHVLSRAPTPGTFTVTVVPRPGAPAIETRPPSRRARSVMPSKPIDSTLYIRLDTTLSKTNGLIDDFRRNPARYLRHLKLVDVF